MLTLWAGTGWCFSGQSLRSPVSPVPAVRKRWAAAKTAAAESFARGEGPAVRYNRALSCCLMIRCSSS